MPPINRFPFRSFIAVSAALLVAACAAARAPVDEINRIVGLMNVHQGMRVADVGAGNGEYAEALAGEVGLEGHVFATEVEEDDVEDLTRQLEDAGFSNATAVLGEQDDTGLAEDCCDAVLLRLVYHHFTDPAQMRASLRRAMRPGARLVIIDIDLQTHWGDLEGVPDRGGHGIPPDRLIEEMTADGFRVVERFDDWPGDTDHFCIVFEEIDEGEEW